MACLLLIFHLCVGDGCITHWTPVNDDDATINENGGKYAGMERYEARKAIVEELKQQGLLVPPRRRWMCYTRDTS